MKIAVAVLLLFGAAFFLFSPHRAAPPSPPSFPPSYPPQIHLPPAFPPPLNPPLPDAGGLIISPPLDQIPCPENGVIAISALTAEKGEFDTLRRVVKNHRKCADHAEIRHVALLSPAPSSGLFSSILPLLVAKRLLTQSKCRWKWLIVVGKEIVCNPWLENISREHFLAKVSFPPDADLPTPEAVVIPSNLRGSATVAHPYPISSSFLAIHNNAHQNGSRFIDDLFNAMKDPEIREKGDPVGAALDKVRQTRAKPWDIVIDLLAALEIPFPLDKLPRITVSQIHSQARLLFSHYDKFSYYYSNLARCSKIIGALRPSAWLECLHRELQRVGF